MKRSFLLIASLAAGLTLPAFAQTAPTTASGPAKIAVIAFQVAVAQTNEGQRDFADLQKKFEPRRDQLKALSDQIDTMTKDLQAQEKTLSPVEQQNRANEIDTKRKELDRDSQNAQSDFQEAMQNTYNSLASKVYDVMEGYVQKHGYTLVLDISQQQSPVLYASNNTNITKEVIDAYNQKSGIPAPAAGAAQSSSGIPEAPTPSAPTPRK